MAKSIVHLVCPDEKLLALRSFCTVNGIQMDIPPDDFTASNDDPDEVVHQYLVEVPGEANYTTRMTEWEAANMRMTFGPTVTRIE